MPKKKKNHHKKKVIQKPEFRGAHFLAPEFVYYKKGAVWYLATIVVGLGLIGLAIWLKYWLLSAVIFLSIIVFLQYSNKRPKSKKCSITKEGIKIDEKFFPIESFKSFHIIFDKPASHLFLETSRRFYPSFWLNVKNEDLERVVGTLSMILPEKVEHENFLVKINRWLRF